MFCVELAGLRIRFDHKYDLIREQCADYIVADVQNPDLVVGLLEERIFQIKWYTMRGGERRYLTQEEIEYERCPITNLYPQLPAFDAFWLHAAAVEMDGAAYAFTARSGRGKSTHAKNWLTYYPDRARIINGDEPIIRRVNGIYRAYGTPFCGKEMYNINTSAPLQGLCYLQRGETNAIERMEPTEAFAYLMTDYQNYGTIQEENRLQYMDLLTDFVEKVPVYILTCNQDPEAARVAFEGMRDGRAAMRHGGR